MNECLLRHENQNAMVVKMISIFSKYEGGRKRNVRNVPLHNENIISARVK